MAGNILSSLSMSKYERLLPRMFPDAIRLEIRDRKGDVFWRRVPGSKGTGPDELEAFDEPVCVWSEFGPGLGRRQLPGDETQFRAEIQSKTHGKVGWLVVVHGTKSSIPMSAASDPMRRAFADAVVFLQEEIELIRKALDKHNGKRKYAAQDLGISERTLYRKIKEYNIEQ